MVMNTLYGTDPLRDMRRLQDEINRLVQGAAAPRGGFPTINVYANPDGIVITAELPGVKHEDLQITVHRDTVTLGGAPPSVTVSRWTVICKSSCFTPGSSAVITMPSGLA